MLIPFTDESFEILDSTFSALSAANYPKEKMLIVLASEERVGENAQIVGRKIKEKYQHLFYKFFITAHPDGLPNEIKGKSANASFAVQTIMPELMKLSIFVHQVLVSNFDSDTIVHPEYFARVMYEFLTAEKPYQSSYQPIAIYNNNIWDSPAIIRVVSVSNSFSIYRVQPSRPATDIFFPYYDLASAGGYWLLEKILSTKTVTLIGNAICTTKATTKSSHYSFRFL